MSGINPIPQHASPLEQIASALRIVESVYGIKGAAAKADEIAQMNDVGSNRSKLAQMSHLGALTEMGQTPSPEEKQTILGSNASQLNSLNEGPLLKLALGRLSAQAMANRASGFTDKNGIQVAKDYETTLKPYRSLQEDISKVESALQTKDKNGNPLVTSQQMGDANAALARIFSPNHMSDATVGRTEFESLPAKGAAALQKLVASPQDIGSRDLLNHIIDQAHHIGNVSNQNGLKEIDSLDSGYSSLSSPDVRKLAKAKSDFFRQRLSTKYPTVGEGGAPTTTPDPASANPSAQAPGVPHIHANDIQNEILRRQKLKAKASPNAAQAAPGGEE